MQRLKEAQRKGELALARVYGHRLDARVCERIIEGMILAPEVLCSVSGGINELPTDVVGWDRWAKDAASSEPLAKLSIAHSDAQLREEIRREVLENIRPERRLSIGPDQIFFHCGPIYFSLIRLTGRFHSLGFSVSIEVVKPTPLISWRALVTDHRHSPRS